MIYKGRAYRGVIDYNNTGNWEFFRKDLFEEYESISEEARIALCLLRVCYCVE
jgi:hypothetical protein